MQEIEEADRFLSTAHAGGTEYRYDREMWVRVVEEYDGIIPIKIEAFREGTEVFPYEPVVQITAENGFGELAVWFESKFVQIWAPMERTTAARWWRKWLETKCRQQHPSWSDDQVQFAISIMFHDFGDRAGSCEQESEILGGAHVLVFPGTDTFTGAYQDWKDNGEEPNGCSIHALAHRTVTGFEDELKCHEILYNLGGSVGITAHVSDTNDYYRMVSLLGKRLARMDWNLDGNIVVARPDSGDPIPSVLHVLDVCEENGLFTEDEDGNKCATRLRWIQGDSMNWTSMIQIIQAVQSRGWSPFASGAFGVGGNSRNSIARDHTGLSVKLAEVGDDFRQVCKRSNTAAKTSIPGAVQVFDGLDEYYSTVYHLNEIPPAGAGERLLVTWYDGRNPDSDISDVFLDPCLETPGLVRERILDNFMSRTKPNEVLSERIRRRREEILADQIGVLDKGWQ